MNERLSEIIDNVPTADELTSYDDQHLVTYLRLLDADADGAHWTEVCRVVLGLDPEKDRDRAHRVWRAHLDRAKWVRARGYMRLVLRDRGAT
jgi:hypothetical protein